MFRVFDTLLNIITGTGTDKSKSAGNVYAFSAMQPGELEAAYRGSWLARKVIDIPALDMCREWRDWQAEDDQIELIEAEEKRLDLQRKVLEAKIKARLYGGAAIFIGDGTQNQAEELNPETIGKGGIRYLAVLTGSRITAGEIETDVTSPWFGQPSRYTITSDRAQQVDIHPSRIVRFVGAEAMDEHTGRANGWGDSVLEAVSKALKDAEATATNIADLTHEAKIDVLKVPNLMAMAADHQYEARFQRRTQLAMLAKSLNNTLILDAEEDYQQKTASFSTLPDVLDRFLQMAAGAADIPLTRLLGQSPAGMNATGESDYRNYLDRINAGQRLELGPAMALLDECLIRSALGSRPKEIHYIWAPLWQLSEKDKADVHLKKAQALQIHANSGLLPDSALAKGLENQLIEDSVYPGFEAAMDDAKPIDFDEKAAQEAAAAQAQQQASVTRLNVAANDAEPRPLYVHRKVTNGTAIIAWAKSQGFTSTLEASDLHVTIAYSKAPVDWMAVGESWESKIEIGAGGPRVMEQFGEATVLLIPSRSLKWRHDEIREAGASWDHEDYQPHITISYGGAPAELSKVVPYQGEIVLGPEIFEPLDEDWKAKVTSA